MVIGTGITLAGVLTGLMQAQFSSVNGRIDDLRSDIRGIDEACERSRQAWPKSRS